MPIAETGTTALQDFNRQRRPSADAPLPSLILHENLRLMTILARCMELLFIVIWFIAAGSWFYTARFFLPMWANRFQSDPRHAGYWQKTLIGAGIFLFAIFLGFVVGELAYFDGGGS